MILNFNVTGQEIDVAYPTIVEKTVDYLDAQFLFSPEWKETTKTAHFVCGKEHYAIILENDTIPKSKHLNLNAGIWRVFVEGYKLPEKMKITTDEVAIHVKRTGELTGDIPPETPQSQVDYLIELTTKAVDTAESVRRDADNGAFKGDKGDKGFSAYEVAVNNGFIGTEAEWLKSLEYQHSEEFETLSQQVHRDAVDSANNAEIARTEAAKVRDFYTVINADGSITLQFNDTEKGVK